MESLARIQSTHLRDLLRFAEQKHQIPIHYGELGGSSPSGIAVLPTNGATTTTDGTAVMLEINDTPITVGITEGRDVRLTIDLGAILLGTSEMPAEAGDLTPAAFVSRALDAVIDHAVELYRARIAEGLRQTFIRARCRSVRQRETELRRTQRDLDDRIRRQRYDLEANWRRKLEIDQQLDAIEQLTRPQSRRNASDEFDRLNRLIPSRFSKIVVNDYDVIAVTTAVMVEHNGQEYRLGRYEVKVPFSPESGLRIQALDRAPHTTYAHPHVDSDGVVCWGNLAPSFAECRGSGDILHQLLLSDELLRSYNPGSPYATIDRWDPDWSEEDNYYERCYDDADAYYDCVCCDDDACPFWADRHDRCWSQLLEQIRNRPSEEADILRRCISCGRCEHQIEADERLAELNNDNTEEERS